MFIVIDGNDGAGKTTQAQLLVDYLISKNKLVEYVDFPRYDTEYGKVVAAYLNNEYGPADTVSPYLASLPYALDRMNTKEQIQKVLEEGGYVIANRYVSSNMAYQGAKCKTKEEQEKFLEWIQHLEYEYHGIPKEDKVIYLYVPRVVSDKLIESRDEKAYLNGKQKDGHEEKGNYLDAVQTLYLEMAEKNPTWHKIICTENETLLSKEQVHQKILQILNLQ